MGLVELDQRVAGQRVERRGRRRHARRRMIAEERLVQALLRQKPGLRPLVDEARRESRLVAIDLDLRERRVHQHVRHQREHGVEVVGQARCPSTCPNRAEMPAPTLTDAASRSSCSEICSDVFVVVPSRISAAVNVGQTRRRRRIVVAARAVDEHREEDLRRAVILDDDEVDAVREVRFLRLGQRHPQDVLVDRRLALEDRARLLRRIALLSHRRLLGGQRRRRARRQATAKSDDASLRHLLSPAAAFGIVITTERFSLVRYFFATRCTSAAVDLLVVVRARVHQVGIVVEERVLAELDGALERAGDGARPAGGSRCCAPCRFPSPGSVRSSPSRSLRRAPPRRPPAILAGRDLRRHLEQPGAALVRVAGEGGRRRAASRARRPG